MNFNSLEKFNEKRKNIYISLIVVAIICAVVFAGLLQGIISLLTWIIKLVIKYWKHILMGIAALLVLKKLLFRRKQKVQEMRIVE